MAANQSLLKLQRKLEIAELKHLRRLAGALHKQREAWRAAAKEMHERLKSAEESALFWQRHAMNLQDALDDDAFSTHRCVGINKSGELMVVKTDA